MKRPTIVQTITTIAALLGIVSILSSGAYKFHMTNAYAEDVQMVEQKVQQGLDAFIQTQKSERCQQWLSEITMLESREADGTLTQGQRDRLIWLRNQYDSKCGRSQ